jgi:Ca2+/Na+ antiporter
MNIILLLLAIIVFAVILKLSINIIIVVGLLFLGYFIYTKYFLKGSSDDSLEYKKIDVEEEQSH